MYSYQVLKRVGTEKKSLVLSILYKMFLVCFLKELRLNRKYSKKIWSLVHI